MNAKQAYDDIQAANELIGGVYEWAYETDAPVGTIKHTSIAGVECFKLKDLLREYIKLENTNDQ